MNQPLLLKGLRTISPGRLWDARRCGRISAVTFRYMVDRLLDLPGSRYSCIAATEGGEIVAEAGDALLEPSIVLRWGMEASAVLEGSGSGGLDDFILTSGGHYHLVRPLGEDRSLLVYLCVERARANLAVARRELAAARPGVAATGVPEIRASAPVNSALPAASRTAAAMPPASRPPADSPVATGAAGVPLPRRAGTTMAGPLAARPPRRSPVAPVLGQDWADDIPTMNRLLVALRTLSGRIESP
jgi:hypothetical protein